MNDKMSMFEGESMRTMNTLEQLEQQLNQIQIDQLIHKKPERHNQHKNRVEGTSSAGRGRKNGSIQNTKKSERDHLD